MKIKSEKEQLREKLNSINIQLSWQERRLRRCKRKYKIKKDWITSFWIFSDSDTLNFIVEMEQEILTSLEEYENLLQDKLLTQEKE